MTEIVSALIESKKNSIPFSGFPDSNDGFILSFHKKHIEIYLEYFGIEAVVFTCHNVSGAV